MPSPRILLTGLLALGSISSVLADVSLAGCYDNFGDTSNFGPNTYQTQGLCMGQCQKAGLAVFAVTKGSTCFCGDQVPTKGKVDSSECNTQCQGYGENCGGDNAWLFGYTGNLPSSVPKPVQSSSSSKTQGGSSTNIAVETTVVVQSPATVTAASKDSTAGSGGGSSKAGIAAGAVVGVVAVIAIGVGAFLLVRRQRRLRAEEEYRTAVANKEFTASIKKPMQDSRLDPVMLQHRRLSDGSIADNQDFSRRILKVTNPDGP